MTAPERASDAPGGEDFGNYTIYGKIAAGGMAAVFLGRERAEPRRWVAIKRVHPHLVTRADVVQMFLNEARIVSRLSHPNICGIIDYGVHEESPYIVMRYLHGAPLSGLLRRIVDQKLPLPVDLMAYVAGSILDGLHYAHDATSDDGQPLGLVHRDISPQNIFITFEGEIALLDFGVAKAAGYTGFTRTGHIKGKYAYMSPEQVEAHPLDRRSDVFSLGIVLWEALAGKHLFRRKRHIDTLRAIANAEVPSISAVNPSVPHALEAIVARALVGDRRLRYQTARALASDLRAYLQQRKTKTDTAEVARTMREMFPERRHPSEVPAMRTQPEALALVTETDAAPRLAHDDELPSIADELPPSTQPDLESISSLGSIGSVSAVSIAPDTLVPHDPEPPRPDAGSEPTEQLDVVMIGDRVELGAAGRGALETGALTLPISLAAASAAATARAAARDPEETFDDATIQLNWTAPPMRPPSPPPAPRPAPPANDARATIPDQKFSFPARLTVPVDSTIPAPTIVDPPDTSPFRPRPLIAEPVARPEKASPVVAARKRSQAGSIVAAALACLVGFGAYVSIVRLVRTPPAKPALVSPTRAAPKIVQREDEAAEPAPPPPRVEPEPAVIETSKEIERAAPSSKKVPRPQLLKARELEREGRKALMAGDLARAEKMLLECTRLVALANCHRSLGVLYAQTADVHASIVHYKRYLELAPNAEDAQYVRKIINETR